MSSRNLNFWFVVCIVASSGRVAFAQNGACCDDLTGTCTTDVLEANCQGPDFRFHGGNNCSLFNPPCGEGACCLGLGGPCQIQTEANCTLLGGVAWVRGELCSANMCADCDGSLVADGFEIDQGIVPDCNNNGIPDSCDITSNPGIDCNINGIPDSCDIANDPSSDCNNNNSLDVCEIDMNSPAPGGPYFCSSGCDPDCNENGVPDACDIALGDPDGNGDTSPDCNHNGKPDECEIDENSPAPGGPWYCTSNCLDDCDDDGIPDVCEIPENCSAPGGPYFCEEPGCNPDCNNNGIPDNCDIAAGTSLDVNPADGIPDECRYWTGASTVDDNWFTPENWQPQTVPNNAGAVRFCAVIDGNFSVILDQNAAVDTLKLLGTSTLTHATGSLTIDSINGVVNEGTIVINDQRSLIAGDSFAVKGDGKIDLNGDGAKIDSATAGDELTSYVQVEGKGQITGTFVNTSIGEVNANDPTGSIVLTGTIENNGLLAAAIGGTMKILTNISTLGGGQSRIDGHGANVEIGDEDDDPRIVNGDGPIVVRPGSPALLQIEKASVNNYTSWNIGDNQIGPLMEATANVIAGSSALVAGPLVVDQNGEMNVDASVITSASIELRDGNELNITGGGSLVTTGAFVNRGTVESAYNWGGGTVLRMIGITTSCDVNQWPSKLEAGGTDFGPVNPAGYNNNFDFSVIEVGPNASAVLFDQINNGNRSGPFGADEAVYADQLLLGPNARIHLNGLKLYVAGNQVVPGPFGGGIVQDNGACCLSNGTCVSQSPECCAMADGAFLGFGVDCTPGLCVGACCHLEGYCTETPTESDCLAEGGVFQGLSTSCLTASCPIGNDTCMTAAPLMVGSTVFVNTTDALTDVVPSGNCGTTALNKGVWFSVVGNGQTITISTCNPGTNFDTMIQVFCECADFVCVGGNDDATPGDSNCLIAGQNLKSRFSWCTAPGQTYLIQLGGFGTTFGVAELSITTNGMPCGSPPTCIPENRRCCYADGIAGVCQDLTAGGCAAQPFGMWGAVGQTCGTPCPIGRCCYLELGVGACVTSNQAECNARGGAWVAGQTCAGPPCPVNDNCDSATAVTCGMLITGTLIGAGNNYDPGPGAGSCTGFAAIGADVVYVLNIPVPQNITISMDPSISAFDASVYVVTDCTNVAGTCVAGADDLALSGESEILTFDAAPGTYYIIADKFGSSQGGEFDLTIDCAAPSIGRCCYTQFGVNELCDVTTQFDCLGPAYSGIWTADVDCLSFCPLGRCCQGGGACGVYTQDHCLDVGGTWTIGQTCLPESCIPPANSTCATAHVVTCGSVVVGSNVGASDDYVFTAAGCSGFASLGPDVVYSIVSPTNQPLTITMDPADSDLGLYVVTDCSNAQASCVVADDSGGSGTLESVVFNATAGVTYYILIDTFNNSGSPGDDFVLQVECTSCPSCPGDMQIDGYLEGSDIQGFVDCFLTPGPVCACADMDQNGILNLVDVVEFVNAMLSKNCSP